jgi:hypothetical protein
MAKNTAKNKSRKGAVAKRDQVCNPRNYRWTKRDLKSGRLMDQKADEKPFKGVRKTK